MENVTISVNVVNFSDILKRLKNIENAVCLPKEETETPQDKLLTRNEVAQLLNISLPTLHTWPKQGVVKSYRVGSSIRFKQSEVYEALNRQ